jgi:hypothetical protein
MQKKDIKERDPVALILEIDSIQLNIKKYFTEQRCRETNSFVYAHFMYLKKVHFVVFLPFHLCFDAK